jgi:hypothetical protein
MLEEYESSTHEQAAVELQESSIIEEDPVIAEESNKKSTKTRLKFDALSKASHSQSNISRVVILEPPLKSSVVSSNGILDD